MSHYVFSFISFSFICNVCNIWMLYKREEKKNEKWGRGVNCEEEMREKNKMGEEGCVCVVGEKKKERQAGTWVVGKKKKKKEIKRKKEMGSGVYVYGGKKEGVEKKEEEKI